MVTLSIIVPVYNCAAYLSRCLDSILAQTLTDFQLILVDDGSTDGTSKLCDQYAGKDPRITVIHQTNAGVSAARNAGLGAASGEYIGFVDADDWVAPHMFASLYENAGATGADMVMCDAVTIWENGQQEPDTIPLLNESCILPKADISPDLLRLIAGAVWRCLYRSDLLLRNQLRFPTGLKFSEDRIFNLQAMGTANTISYLKEGLYCRAIRPGSATTSVRTDFFDMQLQAYAHAEKILLTYWGESFLPIYQKMLIIDGALQQIYQICKQGYPLSSLPKRLAAIRAVANQPALRNAFSHHNPNSMRESLLYRKASVLLLFVGFLVNWKNR